MIFPFIFLIIVKLLIKITIKFKVISILIFMLKHYHTQDTKYFVFSLL